MAVYLWTQIILLVLLTVGTIWLVVRREKAWECILTGLAGSALYLYISTGAGYWIVVVTFWLVVAVIGGLIFSAIFS